MTMLTTINEFACQAADLAANLAANLATNLDPTRFLDECVWFA